MADTLQPGDTKTDVQTEWADQKFTSTAEDAQIATHKEQSMSLWKGITLYPKAIGWSMLLSRAIVMEGYDGVLMGSFYAVDAFNKKYGSLQTDGTYYLSAAWQSGLSNSMSVGQIFGLFICGLVSERLGYRKTMLSALCAVICFIFILFFAPSVEILCVGEILMGISLGIFQTITVTYASEVCPVVLRCYLTTYVNLCWVIGQLIASGILRGFVARTDEWAYRIPFAIQWVWPIPIMVGVFLAPESPWWLVRQGRQQDAMASLNRLTNKRDTEFGPNETVAMMKHTNELEKEIEQGTTFLDCFKGVDLRRTEIVCLTWGVQNLCGSGIMGYSTYFYKQAGLSSENAFNMSLAQAGIGFFGTVFSWFLMTRYGRRSLYVGGLTVLFTMLMAIGFSSLGNSSNRSTAWATGSLLVVYTLFYDMTVGPVCYSLVSELSLTRLRAKTIVLARNLYNILSIINGIIIPHMLNEHAWNWRAKAGFFWAGLCALCVAWAFFRLPEPKGRTYGELDVLFQKGIRAREFKHTMVEPFTHCDSLDQQQQQQQEKLR